MMAPFFIEFTMDDRLSCEFGLADDQVVQARLRYEMYIRTGRIITNRPPWEPFPEGRWHLVVRYNHLKGEAQREVVHVGLSPKTPHGVKVVTRWGYISPRDMTDKVCRDLLENWNAYRTAYAGPAAKIGHPDGIALAEGNLALAAPLLRNLLDQPKLLVGLPAGATIVFQPEDDPWLQDQNRVFVSRVEKLALRDFGEPSNLTGLTVLIQAPRPDPVPE